MFAGIYVCDLKMVANFANKAVANINEFTVCFTLQEKMVPNNTRRQVIIPGDRSHMEILTFLDEVFEINFLLHESVSVWVMNSNPVLDTFMPSHFMVQLGGPSFVQKSKGTKTAHFIFRK